MKFWILFLQRVIAPDDLLTGTGEGKIEVRLLQLSSVTRQRPLDSVLCVVLKLLGACY